jgi:hypothetical protein
MELLIQMVLVKAHNLDLFEPLVALRVLELGMELLLFAGLLRIQPLILIESELLLGDLSVGVLLQDVVGLGRAILFEQELFEIIIIHFDFLVLLQVAQRRKVGLVGVAQQSL